jgi:hypothetical protein
MDVFDDLLAAAIGLHALVGVIIFFGGLCLFAVEALRGLARTRQTPVVNNLYVENLHVHVTPAGAPSPSDRQHDHTQEVPAPEGHRRGRQLPSLKGRGT